MTTAAVFRRPRRTLAVETGDMKMRVLLGGLIGAGIGFLVGYFGRCTSGACPLTGNPYISTILGALLGALIATGK
jgi:hypothetical protein